MSELGLGVATPEFAKAFAIVAVPIVFAIIFLMLRRI